VVVFLNSLADEQLGFLVANNFSSDKALLEKAVNAANIRVIRMIQFLPTVIAEAERQIEETKVLKMKMTKGQERGTI
jgi:hypothetical protein